MSDYNGPQRIVCLTDETTEVLYLLGQEWRIAGVSGFTTRPKEARQKPKTSTFKAAKIGSILELQPDLVIGFSHIQAGIAHELIAAGVSVLIFNQRSVEEILAMTLTLARLVGAEQAGQALVEKLQDNLRRIAQSAARFPLRPRVFFEEWMDPLISGIGWVQELIEISGGAIVLPEIRAARDAKQRTVTSDAVLAADPDVIVASWCGRKIDKEKIRSREGWAEMAAVRNDHIYEIASGLILQPGPAALTEGVRQLHAIIARVVNCTIAGDLASTEVLDPDLGWLRPGEEIRV